MEQIVTIYKLANTRFLTNLKMQSFRALHRSRLTIIRLEILKIFYKNSEDVGMA